MNYQLDTDVIIYHLRGYKKLQTKWLEREPVISVITLGELLYGAKKSNRPQKSTQVVKKFLKDFKIRVMSLGPDLIETYAQHKAILEQQGDKLDDFDLLIGITAKENNLTLVTNNYKHFQKINGLKLEK